MRFASRLARVKYLLLVLVACGAPQRPPRPTEGAIAGLVRDQNSGQPIATADLQLSTGAHTTSARDGLYTFDHVAPGRYTLVGRYAGQPVTVKNIVVDAGEATYVDVTFTLGEPKPIVVDLDATKPDQIRRYHPPDASTVIEGTVNQVGTRERVAGAVVTAVGGPRKDVLQTVTDDQGRYRFEQVEPGTYAISAYYSIGGRGQIEVRRSDIEVDASEAVIVPLWVEVAKQ